MIYGPPPESLPLERYQFSTASFPRIPKAEILTPFLSEDTDEVEDAEEREESEETAKPDDPDGEPAHPAPPASDLPEQFRAALSRLSSLKIDPLPAGCTFTVVIELRDDGDVEPPISRDQSWIAAEPAIQKPKGDVTGKGNKGRTGDQVKNTVVQNSGGVRTTPVRKLEAGAFILEVWVEEAKKRTDKE